MKKLFKDFKKGVPTERTDNFITWFILVLSVGFTILGLIDIFK